MKIDVPVVKKTIQTIVMGGGVNASKRGTKFGYTETNIYFSNKSGHFSVSIKDIIDAIEDVQEPQRG